MTTITLPTSPKKRHVAVMHMIAAHEPVSFGRLCELFDLQPSSQEARAIDRSTQYLRRKGEIEFVKTPGRVHRSWRVASSSKFDRVFDGLVLTALGNEGCGGLAEDVARAVDTFLAEEQELPPMGVDRIRARLDRLVASSKGTLTKEGERYYLPKMPR